MRRIKLLLNVAALLTLTLALTETATAVSVVTHWSMDDNAANSTVACNITAQNGIFYSDASTQNTTLAHNADSQEGTGSLNFDGIDDYVEVPGYKGITGPASRTCAAWVKTQASQRGCILNWGDNGTIGKNWVFFVEQGGELAVATIGATTKTTTSPLGDNNWHHVAAVLVDDGSPNINEVLLYIDGVQQQSTSTSSIALDTLADSDVMMGAYRGTTATPSIYFEGLLDDVRIYNYALSADDILEMKTWGPSPVHNASGVLVDSHLSWTSQPDALSYDVYFSTNSTPDYLDNTNNINYDPGVLAFNTTYYWRIDKVTASGTETGTVWNFTTSAEPGPASEPSPANGAIDVLNDTTLSWTAGEGALSHNIYLGTDSTPEYLDNTSGTTYLLSQLDYNTTYYWRIDEVTAYGTETGAVWSFTTVSPGNLDARWKLDDDTDNTTVLDSSANSLHGTFNDSTNPNTNFHHSSDRAEGTGSLVFDGVNDYIQVYGYKGIAGSASRSCTAWVKLSGNQQGAIVCWGTSTSQEKWIFRIEPGGALGVGIYGGWIKTTSSPLLDDEWHHIAVVFDEDATPNINDALLYIDGTQQSTTYSAVTINTGNVQDVMIGAHREDENGGGTPNMHFNGLMDDVRIYDYALSPTEILEMNTWDRSPENEAIDLPIDTTLIWPAGDGADSYDIYFGTNSTPEYIDNFMEQTYDPGLLNYGTTYYWRIDEVSTSGTTTGTVWNFTTVIANATEPSPANGATDIPLDATLSWTAPLGIDYHKVYFGTNPTPGANEYIDDFAEATYDPALLSYNTTYYWRIDEVDGLGSVTTGTVWNFTTVAIGALDAHWEMDEYKWDGTVYDSSDSGYNGQFSDASGVSYAFHHFRADCRQGFGSLWFDGIDDSITVSGYKGITGTASRSCTAWIKTNATAAQDIIGWGDSTTAGGQWLLTLTSSGTVQVAVSGGSQTGATVVNDGQWHHIVAVLASNGSSTVNDIQLYIDGIEESSYTTVSSAVDTVYDADVQIGRYNDGGENRYFEGLMDDVRIYGYDLSAQEIRSLNPSFIWSMDDNAASTTVLDSGINSKHGTFTDSTNPNTSAHHSSDCREGTGSLSFDGIDDSIQITGLQGVTGPFARTCSAWIKTSAATSQTIMAWGSSAGRWQFGITSGGTLEVKPGLSGYTRGVTVVNDGQWHYVAAVMTNDVIHAPPEAYDNNKTKNDTFMIKLYVDGTEEPDYSMIDLVVNTISGADVQIGAYNGADYFNGLMDDVRLYGYALSDQEIHGQFAWNPTPNDGLLSEPSILSWESGDSAVSHNVYFGTDYNAVKNAERLAGDINGDGPADINDLLILAAQWLTNPGIIDDSADIDGSKKVDIGDFAALAATWGQTPDAAFKGNQLDTTYDPGTLVNETTYYWRVDEVDPSRSESTSKGRVWSFTYMPMLTPEEFAILPWNGVGGLTHAPYDRVTLNTIRNCGFNLAGFVEPDKFDIVQKSGLKAFAFDWNTAPVTGTMANLPRTTIDGIAGKMVHHIGNHPATFGYFLVDEPYGVWPGLANWVDSFYQADPNPDHLAYINLLPRWTMTSSDYLNYVNDYVSIVQNRFISYDFYPIENNTTTAPSLYYENLEVVSAAAKNAGIPFWNIVLSTPHFSYATPTYGIFNFQLYTTLAYGAGGISYFTYFAEPDFFGDAGPVDPDGHKSSIWYDLRNINLEMHRIGPVYTSLNHENTFHHPNVLSSYARDISSSLYVESIDLTGYSLCVGEFTDPTGTPYVLLVNLNVATPIQFNITFKTTPSEIWYLDYTTGQLRLLEGSTITLMRGKGLFLKLVN